jgi:nitrogen fixation protein FixH
LEGVVELYRPSDRTKDVRLPLKMNSANVQSISGADMLPGMWRIKIQWTHASRKFYHEDIVMIP